MKGYRIGSQEWYDYQRKRLVEISKVLRSPETSQEDKDKLFCEQVDIADSLLLNYNANLINNPII